MPDRAHFETQGIIGHLAGVLEWRVLQPDPTDQSGPADPPPLLEGGGWLQIGPMRGVSVGCCRWLPPLSDHRSQPEAFAYAP